MARGGGGLPLRPAHRLPFPGGEPDHEDDLIVPAREGTLRVLRAARDAGVERVVVTSSFAAIGYGRPATEQPFTEDDWTDPDSDIPAYIRSKVLAERAAWDFVEREGNALQLATVAPVASSARSSVPTTPPRSA